MRNQDLTSILSTCRLVIQKINGFLPGCASFRAFAANLLVLNLFFTCVPSAAVAQKLNSISSVKVPARMTIGIALAAITATPVYAVGSIPSQEIHQGGTLQFQIQSPKSGTATFSFTLDPTSPAPHGELNLDQVSGLFTYKPADTDKFEFRLNFISLVAGASPDSQLVSITPMSNLPPETDLLGSSHPLPDPASTEYLLVTQSQNSAQEVFNTILRTTWNVDISGKTVIFDSSTLDHGGLYTRFNGRPDVKTMAIYAETLIVRSPLKLPGTNVLVYARHLRFEDTAGQASLDTTPIGYSTRPDQSQDGISGQNAGNITLNIQDFFSQSGPAVRLIANGGSGQNAGEGRPGNPAPDLVPSAPNAGNWGP